MKTIVIRADAGSKIGSGHVARQICVAQEFQRQGNNVIWAVTEETLQVKPEILNWNYIILPDIPERPQINHMFSNLSCDIGRPHIMIDGFNLGEATTVSLRSSDRCDSITFMDEKLNRPLGDIDILIDIFSHDRFTILDKCSVTEKTEVLIGPHYSPMPRSITNFNHLDIKPTDKIKKNVILMNGGLNIGDLLQKISAALSFESQSFMGVQFTAFMLDNDHTSHTVKDTKKAFQIAQKRGLSINLRCNEPQDKLHQFMAQADTYIGSAGSTTIYEMSALGGCAFVAIGAGHTQDEMAEIIENRAMGVNAGQYMALDNNGKIDLNSDFNWKNLLRHTHEILTNDNLRHNMKVKSALFFDGRGASRVVSAVLKQSSPKF